MTIQTKLHQAFEKQRAGELSEAAEAYKEILRIDSAHPDALHLLGLIESSRGNYQQAVALIQQAVKLTPSSPVLHGNLGVVLRHAGKIEAAIDSYRKSIELDPTNPDAHFNLGKSLKIAGQEDEAERLFRKAISLSPNKVAPWLSLVSLYSGKDLDQAIIIGEQAVQFCPGNADAQMNLGSLYRRSGQVERAIACFRKSVELAPRKVDAICRLASTLVNQHNIDEGKEYLALAQSIEPESIHVLNSLGLLHNTLGNSTAAIQAYRRAIQLYPSYGTAHSNLSSALRKQGCLTESLMCVQRGLELEPKNIESRVIEAGALMSLGRVKEAAESFQMAIDAKKGYREAHDGLLMCQQYQSDQTLASLLLSHQEWNQRYAASVPVKTLLPVNTSRSSDAQRDRPLRLGFVSADIGSHPVGYFTARLFEALNREKFATTIYSDRIGQDEIGERIKQSVSRWTDTAALSDEELAEKIVEDGIDILFDMAGHTAQNRLLVFARRVAPIQISWAGYVGTTGLKQMDYLLADRFHVPVEDEAFYSEKVLRMPHGYVTYLAPKNVPDVSALPALVKGSITFGAMCNPAKVNENVLQLWACLLKRVPKSRLLLCYSGWPDEGNVRRVEQTMSEAGCFNRIDFEQRSGALSLMSVYNEVDIALDTFPYSGGLTTCEAMWMGVPTVTFPGGSFSGRHSYSHLSNVGLARFIAEDESGYIAKAIEFATDLEGLNRLRLSMRSRVAESPLCDGPRFARDFEALMRRIWDERA